MNIENMTFDLQDFQSRKVCVPIVPYRETIVRLMEDLEGKGVLWLSGKKPTEFIPETKEYGRYICISRFSKTCISLTNFSENMMIMSSDNYEPCASRQPSFDDLDALLS